MLYNPPAFRIADSAELIEAIGANGFATLVSNGAAGPVATHLPLFHEPEGGPFGRLIGHIARANPHRTKADLAAPSIAIFLGPDAYISPEWYAAKREHGKVVPTWNYTTIHAVGVLRIHDDPEWLRDAVTRLTGRHEARRARPWAVDDAPAEFVAAQLRGIVGVELVLAGIEGKAKLSQNRSEADRSGVVAGLAAEAAEANQGVLSLMRRNERR